jgi:hypothetical protein
MMIVGGEGGDVEVIKPDDLIFSSEPFKDWDDNAGDLKLSNDETHQDITDLSLR